MDQPEISSSVPVPAVAGRGVNTGMTDWLRGLKPGESFLLNGASPHNVRVLAGKLKPASYTVAKDETGQYRVWRLEP